MSFRPQQGLTIMNAYKWLNKEEADFSFRPQQGLTIMNQNFINMQKIGREEKGFRPQQGLTIMNLVTNICLKVSHDDRFRPQQGLTIMNVNDRSRKKVF